ncbi:MAG TPA: P-II family nitrogen regulator [Candidatus Omnitrophica bacterium]|nr:P-II family nitrogen regulator [Candidatus Omnitrophota bacterium]
MKKIEAYIQPFMLQKVTDALHEIHIHGMSVLDARGFGQEKDESYPHHSRESVVDFTPKVKIEIICLDEDAERIVKTIQETAHTGRKGDGKIFAIDIEKAVSVRTGAKNGQAI